MPILFYQNLLTVPVPACKNVFWIIKNGIKMTGMPAFASTHDDKAIWAITAFMLNKMNSLSPEEYREMVKKAPGMEM